MPDCVNVKAKTEEKLKMINEYLNKELQLLYVNKR